MKQHKRTLLALQTQVVKS